MTQKYLNNPLRRQSCLKGYTPCACGGRIIGGTPPVLLRAVARSTVTVFFFLGGEGVGGSESSSKAAFRFLEGPA